MGYDTSGLRRVQSCKHNNIMPGRRKHYDGFSEKPTETSRSCDHPDCTASGTYRAPVSRARLHEYYWFCIEHIRDYNRNWNYYSGLSDADVEKLIRQDYVGHRPTWPLGQRNARLHNMWTDDDKVEILFDLDGGNPSYKNKADPKRQAGSTSPISMSHDESLALNQLDLRWPVSFEEVRGRYVQLVKRLHPDANGGNARAEEKLKRVNHAYSTLKKSSLFDSSIFSMKENPFS